MVLLLGCGVAELAADETQLTRYGNAADRAASDAVKVRGATLLHTDQIVPNADAKTSFEQQTNSVLQKLRQLLDACELSTSDLVKLNIYLSDEQNREVCSKQLLAWYDGDARPAVSFVQTRLPNKHDQIGLDAVIAGESPKNGSTQETVHVRSLRPGDAVYVSGQAEPGDLQNATRATLKSLIRTIGYFKLKRDHVVSLKCFLNPMTEAATVEREVKQLFQGVDMPVVSYVEWTASGTRPIEIEMIATAPSTTAESSVTYFTPPEMKASPVYSRVARIHGDNRIYLSGFVSPNPGSGQQQTEAIFEQIIKTLKMSGSDLTHLAKATYYVSDDEASQKLNQLRPQYYDPKRPPAASKAMVTGVGHAGRQLSIDLIAAPTTAP